MTRLSVPILFCFLFVCCRSNAQEGTQNVPLEDSLFTSETTTVQAESESSYFNRIESVQPAEVRQVPDSVVRRTKADQDYWYLDQQPRKKEQKQEAAADRPEPAWRKWLFWTILIGVFIAILVWSLLSGDVRLFRRAPKPIQGPEEEAEDLETEDIFSIHFDREIEKARSVRNYRLIIRLHYLRTLKLLSQRGLIDYAHDRTNSFYVAQLSGTNYYRDFFRLTRHFDYSWYGNFVITEQQFNRLEPDFLTFKQQFS